MELINLLFEVKNLGQVSWKIVLYLIFFIIALFAVFGLIGKLIENIIDRQAKKVDKFMSSLIVSGLVDDEKSFKDISYKKIKLYFFKTSIIPLSLVLLAFIIYFIYRGICNNWSESIFNDQDGIGTLFFTWDFTNATYYFPFGIGGVTLHNTPHFLTDVRVLNYFIFIFGFTGIVWYLINVQGYIARSFRIKKLCDKMFSQNLDNVDLATIFNTNFTNKKDN